MNTTPCPTNEIVTVYKPADSAAVLTRGTWFVSADVDTFAEMRVERECVGGYSNSRLTGKVVCRWLARRNGRDTKWFKARFSTVDEAMTFAASKLPVLQSVIAKAVR